MASTPPINGDENGGNEPLEDQPVEEEVKEEEKEEVPENPDNPDAGDDPLDGTGGLTQCIQ